MSNPLYAEANIEIREIVDFSATGIKITKIATIEEIEDIGIKGVLINLSESIKKYAENLK